MRKEIGKRFWGLFLSLSLILTTIPFVISGQVDGELLQNGADLAPTIDTSIVRSGTYSVKCVATATNWLTTRLYYDAAVEQNTDYIFSLWVYLESVQIGRAHV